MSDEKMNRLLSEQGLRKKKIGNLFIKKPSIFHRPALNKVLIIRLKQEFSDFDI